MGGREKVRRGGLAGEEQPVVDGRGQHSPLICMAWQRVRIGAAGEAVVSPARFGERAQLAAKIIAEIPRDLVDRRGSERAVAGIFQRPGMAAAEKAFDA